MNNIMIDETTPIWQLTVGEFISLMKTCQVPEEPEQVVRHNYHPDEYAYGVSGIAQLLGCSKTMVWRYKTSWLAPAITQVGRKILCNKKMALDLMKERGKE